VSVPRERIEQGIHVEVVPLEARSLQGRHAGLISRTIANVVDLGVVIVFVFGSYIVWAGIKLLWQGAAFTRPTPGFGPAFFFATVVNIGYFTVTWTTAGRTIGDQLMGLRVIGRNGHTMRVGMSFIRAAFCVAFPFGLLWAGVSREDRSVQDLVLRTTVIHDWLGRTGGDDALSRMDRSEDALGSGIHVQPAVADEADDRHPEPIPRVDGE
jgi:uncharacterized RDD family membrane protein YckC